MLFTVFAFVVLLGTVFPLLVEALQDRQTVVGAPYFDRLSTPIGLTLLFLMGVAPVLPWRKASTELLREIRDLQRQHLEAYREAAERSLTLQQEAVDRQQRVVRVYMRVLVAGGVLTVFILGLILYLLQLL